MNYKLIDLGTDIFESILCELTPNSLDLGKNLVVFPGKRPSYFLIDALSKSIKNSFIPPVTLSMDEFVDYLYEKELSVFDKKIDGLSASSIIFNLVKEEDIFSENTIKFSTFLPFGIKIFGIFEEFKIENVSFDMVRQEDFFIEALKTRNNLLRLSDIYKKFYEELNKRGFSTRSLRYTKVANQKPLLKNFDRIIIAGFHLLTKTEKQLFKILSFDERVVFLFQGKESLTNFTGENNLEVKDYFVDKISLFEMPDSHSEVFKVASEVKKLCHSKPEETVLIIAPSADNIIPLINILNIEFDKYNISLGYPLIRTPLFSFIKNLIDTISTAVPEGVYINNYLKFALHPYTKNISFKSSAEITRIIFHSIEKKLKERPLDRYISLNQLEDENFLKDIYIETDINVESIASHIKYIHKNTIGRLQEIRNIKSFAIKIKEIIEFIYKESTAKRHILFYPYCEAMIECLFNIQTSLIADESLENLAEYLNFLKSYLSYIYVPFKGTPIRPIQILGILESRSLRFDNVFILDFNEGVFPDTDKEDPLLPYDVRVRLGLPTYKDRDMLYDHYLRNIIAGSKKVNIFYVENDSSEKSRFVETIIWEKQKKEKKLNPYQISARYNFNLRPYNPKKIEKTAEIFDTMRKLTFSASLFDIYYECPLKFYYKYILMPEENIADFDHIQHVDIGNLIHEFLRNYFINKDIDYTEEKFTMLLNKSFENYFGKKIRGEAVIIKYQSEKKLREFILNYREKIVGNNQTIQILDLERGFERKICFKTLGELNLKGKIDRLEKRDNQLFVIDYKTSARTEKYRVKWKKFAVEDKNSWKKAFKTVQLFFYIYLLWEDGKYGRPYNASIIPLGLKDIKELKLFNSDDELNNINYVPIIIEKLIDELFSEAPFTPTDDKSNCNFCIYKTICYC